MEEIEKRNSTFVSVLGWVMIIFCGLGLFISIMQNIMIHLTFPVEEMQEPVKNNDDSKMLHEFFLNNLRLVFAVMGFVILSGFVSSIAFLKRKNWGRIGLIILLTLGIIYIAAAQVVQWEFIWSINKDFNEFEKSFHQMSNIILISSSIFFFAIITVFAWLIKKLNTLEVIAEFKNTRDRLEF